ncbi:MAG: hypothetical protein HKN20_01930 [Gemmatimonadetes bacterium]|nr:hypothetical protein [Gemmatimonadota bacterium]
MPDPLSKPAKAATADAPLPEGTVAPPPPPGRWWIPVLGFLLVAGILGSYFSGHFLREGWDGYSYLGTVRALGALENDAGRYANPAYVVISALHHSTGTDPLLLLALLAVINGLLFVAATYLFFRQYFSPTTVACILFAELFLWGRLQWSGTYSLVDGYAFFYPQTMGYVFLLLSLYLLRRAMDRPAYFVPLGFLQALLMITHIGTSLYYWLLVCVHIGVFRALVTPKFVWRLGAAGVGACLLALTWPYYDYMNNLGIFIDRLRSSFAPEETAAITVSFLAVAMAAGGAVKAAPKRTIATSILVVLPLLGPQARLLFDIFGLGALGILGLLILVKEGQYLFPIWWGAGAVLFTFGFVDPTRIILASSFALYAGAGVAMARFIAHPRAPYQWAIALAALVLGNLYFAWKWESHSWLVAVVACLALAAAAVLLVRPARSALSVVALSLLALPLTIKWNKITSLATIEPKAFIESHVPEWETVLVVEPNKRGMNLVLGGMQSRNGLWAGPNTDSLEVYTRKWQTPYVMFYGVPVEDVGAEYDILAQDGEAALIRYYYEETGE